MGDAGHRPQPAASRGTSVHTCCCGDGQWTGHRTGAGHTWTPVHLSSSQCHTGSRFFVKVVTTSIVFTVFSMQTAASQALQQLQGEKAREGSLPGRAERAGHHPGPARTPTQAQRGPPPRPTVQARTAPALGEGMTGSLLFGSGSDPTGWDTQRQFNLSGSDLPKVMQQGTQDGPEPPPYLVFGKHVKTARQRAPWRWGGVKTQDCEMAFQDCKSKPVCLPSPRLCGCRPASGGLEEVAMPLAGPQQQPRPEHQPHCTESPPNPSAPPQAAGLRSCPSGVRIPKLEAGVPGTGPGTCACTSGGCPPSLAPTPLGREAREAGRGAAGLLEAQAVWDALGAWCSTVEAPTSNRWGD